MTNNQLTVTDRVYELEKENADLKSKLFCLQQILDTVDANIYWKDLDGKILGMNKSNLESLELALNEVIGKTDKDLEELNLYHENLSSNDLRVIELGGSFEFEELSPYITKPNISEKLYLSRKNCLKNSDGKVIGLVGVSIDITDRKEKEQALETKALELEAEKLRIQEFIHNFHHDLRTPITGVLSNLALLKTYTIKLKDELFHRGLNLVSEGMYAISLMTEQLYLYTKEAKQNDVCSISIDIEKMVKQELNLAMVSIGDRNIIIDHHFIPRRIPRFYSDYVKIMQILRNLLSNSIKYTHEGKIEVIVQIVKQNKDDMMLRIKVADTGAGIAKEDKDRIFEVGYRAEKHRKSGVHGTGFGLALVKKNLDLLKGKFGVISVLGQGTEIWVDIPYKPACDDE